MSYNGGGDQICKESASAYYLARKSIFKLLEKDQAGDPREPRLKHVKPSKKCRGHYVIK